MSLKERIAARLRALFPGVGLSKKSVETVAEKLASGLTDESTDEDIDGKLNARNDVFSFEDQKKHDDYLAGKAAKDKADKDKADKEAAEKAAKGEDTELPADTPEWMKVYMKQQAEQTKALQDQLAAIAGEKVTSTRKDQVTKMLEGSDDKFKAATLKAFGRMQFKDDEEFTEYLSELETDAKDFVKADASEQVGGWKPEGGAGGKTATNKVPTAVASFIKKSAAERTAGHSENAN